MADKLFKALSFACAGMAVFCGYLAAMQDSSEGMISWGMCGIFSFTSVVSAINGDLHKDILSCFGRFFTSRRSEPGARLLSEDYETEGKPEGKDSCEKETGERAVETAPATSGSSV